MGMGGLFWWDTVWEIIIERVNVKFYYLRIKLEFNWYIQLSL